MAFVMWDINVWLGYIAAASVAMLAVVTFILFLVTFLAIMVYGEDITDE